MSLSQDILSVGLTTYHLIKLSFIKDYEILSLQRNIKIVGIFSRLSMRDGKHHYLNLVPRVLNFVRLRLDSQNPIFVEMSELLQKFI